MDVIAALCAFLSVLTAFHAIRSIHDESTKHNFAILTFLSALFAGGAYWFLIYVISS